MNLPRLKSVLLSIGLLAFSFTTNAASSTGRFFEVSSSGSVINIPIVLCLNGQGPLTCQNEIAHGTVLSIRTINRRAYPAVGIKVSDATLAPTNCKPFSNGYCLFPIKSNQSATIYLSSQQQQSYTLGGSVTGLTTTGLVLTSNGQTLSIPANATSFQFANSLVSGTPYNVTVQTQPGGQTCAVTQGAGTINGANVTNVVVSCRNLFAFVVNASGDSVTRCVVNPFTDAFDNCTNTGADTLTNPQQIVLNNTGTQAFVTSGADSTVTQCTVTASGDFTNCANTGGNNFNYPYGIALNSTGTRAFVANLNSNTVTQCTVTATGDFTNCANTGGTGFSLPTGIVLDSSGTRAFVTNSGSSTVTQCTVTAAGAFTNCANTGGNNFNGPISTVLNSAGTRAFVTNVNGSTVTQCTVTASGNFTNCANTGGNNFNGPVGIILNSSGTRAFVTNADNNTVTQCTITAAGAFTNCANTGGNNFVTPFGIVFN